MGQSVPANARSLIPKADAALKLGAKSWVLVAAIGQLVFALATAILYFRATAHGDMLRWNRFMTHAYVPGNGANNAAAMVHVGMAVLMMVAGFTQLVPGLRARAPALHRWTGRAYIGAAFAISLAGLWMVWVRGTPGDLAEHVGVSLNAALIMFCAAAVLRHAIARNIATHRRWALRLFIVAGGVWFFRLGIVLWGAALGTTGFNPRTFEGPLITGMTFASYLVPLAVLEIYLCVQASPSPAARMAMAATLGMATLITTAGITLATFGLWMPNIVAPFAAHTSIAETLSFTIAHEGILAAAKQYQWLKVVAQDHYSFRESELDDLGYQLIRSGRIADAILMFQLNVDAYPKSGNVYDSLGEAYMDSGDKARAIANYTRSLQLNPANANAADALHELARMP